MDIQQALERLIPDGSIKNSAKVRAGIIAIAHDAMLQGLDLMAVTAERERLLAALKAIEPHHIIYPEDSNIRECDLCGGETGHFDSCPFAIVAKVVGDYDLPEPAE